MNDLSQDCEQAAALLEKIVEQFEQVGWRDHASYIQTMASHMLIYKHQIAAKMHPKKEDV